MFIISTSSQAAIIYDFDISVNFQSGLTTSQQNVFSQAEEFWESIIIGYQNEYAGPGLVIDASGPSIDGPGGVLGQAGPTRGQYGPEHFYAKTGIMKFDAADLLNMENNHSLFDVIVHEMAHVIGFGTLWSFNNLTANFNGFNQYIGENALKAHQFDVDPAALYVPVEQDGGSGTAGSHWDEPNGGGYSEIMTGWLDLPTTINLATIHSFVDLGYVINPLFDLPTNVPEPPVLFVLSFGVLALIRKNKPSIPPKTP
jgi:hypothetical protein